MTGQGSDGRLHQPVAGPVVHLGGQAKATTVFFEFRPLQTGGARLLHEWFHLREEIGRVKTNDVPLNAGLA